MNPETEEAGDTTPSRLLFKELIMARRPRKQPSESAYGRGYDFNNPTGGPGPVTARSPRPVQRNPRPPKSPKEFTTDIAERAAKPIPMSGGIGTVLDQSRTLEIPPTSPTPLTDEEWAKAISVTPRLDAVAAARESFAQAKNSALLDSLNKVEEALNNETDPKKIEALERTRDELTAVIKPPK